MEVALPLLVSVGPLPTAPVLEEAAPEKGPPRNLFQQAGTRSSQDAGKARLLWERRGRHPACVCKPVFGKNGFAYTMGDLQICSED